MILIVGQVPKADLRREAFQEIDYRRMYGTIASAWKRSAGRFDLSVTIPANTTALIYVPAASPDSVTESGTAASKARGVTFVRAEGGAAVYEVGSGTYRFASAL